MSSITTSLKRTKIISSDMGDLEDDVRISRSRNYQVYRGMSPSTSNRLELRIRELEDALEAEREGHMRADREVSELSFQLESLNERLEEADGFTSAQSEMNRKRDAELQKVRKDFELLAVQHESSEASLRKKHQDAVNDFSEQIDQIAKSKQRSEKEKQQLIMEVDSIATQCDSALKAKAHGEAKLEGLDDQLRRLKSQNDDFSRQNHDLNNLKARLTQENFELQRQVQELDGSASALSKTKVQLQSQLDDYKNRLDEESRQKSQLTIQINSLSVEYDNCNARMEEEAEASSNLRNQNGKLQNELQQLRSRYEKDLLIRTEELEELRRKSTARIAELEDMAEQARLRASKFEKEKTKLTVEIREITIELDTANANIGELSKRLKHVENVAGDLQRRVDELSSELSNSHNENSRLNAELLRLRVTVNDLSDKNDHLARENKQLSDGLREATSANKDLGRQVTELTSIRVQLEGERDALGSELADTKDALRDTLNKLEETKNILNQLRSDFEQRMREKDEEIEHLRKTGQRALDELQRTMLEMETKYKAELNRLKKRYDVEIREMEIQLETVNRTNIELAKNNKGLANKCKELEIALDDERKSGDEARQAVTVLERKRIALQTELEDIRALLETSERARKNADNELHEAASRISELTITMTSLTSDKRRMEADISAMQGDLDEALNARRAAEDRADRMQNELNRLADELRQEQENYKHAEALRKSLEIEIREISVKLEEAEAFAQREGKRMVGKLQSRLRDLEAELEAEQRRSRELAGANRKMERALNEIRLQADDDRRLVIELQDQVNVFHARIKTLRRQLEEAEEVVTITMTKYRKAQQMLEEADHRADLAERNTSISIRRRGGRSMSVTREVTRVVRV